MIRIALVSFLISTSPCLAQTEESEPIAGRDYPLLGHTGAFAAAARHVSFGEREEFAFYLLRDRRDHAQDRTPYLVVRREVSIVEDWNAEPEDWVVTSTLTWADSRTCSGLVDSVAAMEDLELPTLSVPVFGTQDIPLMTLDGVGYELRSRMSLWGDHAGYDALISSNVGTPLADWVENFRSTAEACWTSDQPPIPERGPDPTR